MSNAAYDAAKKEKVKALKKAVAKKSKSLPILVMESHFYDWNPGVRMTLIVLALGTRSNPEAWIQEDCPLTAEEAIGWCDMSQWRIALRAGKSESQVHKDIKRFERDGVIKVNRWEDDNSVFHDMYQINEDVLKENQRPEQKRLVERPKRYKSRPKKGWFSTKNQPLRVSPEVAEIDEE